MKPAIATITLSPCIDKSTSVPSLMPDKKLKCKTPKLEPGGGGINVARAIKKLGGEVIAIYPAGGYTGIFFNDLLLKEAVTTLAVETENFTRENMVVLDESTNQQYRFGMPGTELKEKEWQKCLELIEQIDGLEFIVASGSLPPGVPDDIFVRIAVIAKKKKAKLIVDTSGEALKQAASEGVYMLKPNLGELGTLLNKEYIADDEVEDAAKSIIDKRFCEIVVVSMGKAGALLAHRDGTYRIKPPEVIVKSTVGAGDSMTAGIVLSLLRKKTLKETLQYGVACGTAATMNAGTELCRLDDAEKLYSMLKE